MRRWLIAIFAIHFFLNVGLFAIGKIDTHGADQADSAATIAQLAGNGHPAQSDGLMGAAPDHALTDAQADLPVAIPRRDRIHHESAARLLAHLFQHQIHHRGQAHAMLAGTAVAPPQLDEFWCANEAHLRAAELAEIGLSEETIWPTGVADRR